MHACSSAQDGTISRAVDGDFVLHDYGIRINWAKGQVSSYRNGSVLEAIYKPISILKRHLAISTWHPIKAAVELGQYINYLSLSGASPVSNLSATDISCRKQVA